MKTKLLIIAALLFLGRKSFAGDRTGIYMTAEDYKNNRLTYASDCGAHRTRILLHDALGSNPRITVIADGQKTEHKKSDVYGFRDCDNKVYRFYNNSKYQLVDSGNVFIYTHEEQVPAGKSFKVDRVYYFSAAIDGELLPVSLTNLQKAYPGNDRFISSLDDLQNNGNLLAYDHIHKMYMINTLYKTSLK